MSSTYEGQPVKINLVDATAYTSYTKNDNRTYFITKEFNDGTFLAHWSDSPWGHVRNQSRGWAIIQPTSRFIHPKRQNPYKKGEIIDYKETYDWGGVYHGYNDETFRQWQSRIHNEHGGLKRGVTDEHGEMWKMED